MMNQISERSLVFARHIDGKLVDVAKHLVGFVAIVELHFADLRRLWRGRLETCNGTSVRASICLQVVRLGAVVFARS